MTNEQKEKLAKVIRDNSNWPLLVEGVSSENFPTAVVLPATTCSSELGVKMEQNGIKFPSWLAQINEKSKTSKRVFLLIEGLNNIDSLDQEKFYGLIKYNGVNGYKLPAGTQIIIVVPNGESEKINKRIASLTISYKVD